MDDADTELECGVEPFQHSVAGPHASRRACVTIWGQRSAEETAKRAVKMTERWKANSRLSTAPWKSRKPRFPHFHSSGGGCFYGTTEDSKQEKLKPFTQQALHHRIDGRKVGELPGYLKQHWPTIREQ